MHNPWRYFNSSPEVIRSAVMLYVAVLQRRNCQARPPPVMRSIIAIAALIAPRFPHTLPAFAAYRPQGRNHAIAAGRLPPHRRYNG